MAHATEMGDFIQSRFKVAKKELPIIGDVRGKGLMVGVELINADGSPAAGIIKEMIKGLGSEGIVMTKCGASVLRLAPPLVISKEQTEKGVDIILSALSKHQW